jgi:hypothetical protein
VIPAYGDVYTEFPSGIKPGKTATYKIRFLATKRAVVDWTLGIFMDGPGQVFFGTGTTVIH